MTIGIGTISTATIASNVTSLTVGSVNFTGSDRYCLVGVAFNNNQNGTATDITSVVIDPGGSDELALAAIANTNAVVGGDDGHCELWGVKAPATTANLDVVVTLNGTLRVGSQNTFTVGVWPLSDVDQTTPAEGGQNFSGNPSANPSLTITSETGDIVFGVTFVEGQIAGVVQDAGVEDWAIDTDGDGCSGAHELGASSVTLDWTITSDKCIAGGCNINAATAGGTNPHGPLGHPLVGPFGGPV